MPHAMTHAIKLAPAALLALAGAACEATDDGAGADATPDVTLDATVDTTAPAPTKELTAIVVAPWHGESPGTFSANVAQECRFLSSGQLYLTGSSFGEKGVETIEMRLGISETVDLSAEAQSFTFGTQPENGTKVPLGAAALKFDYQESGGATINVSHVKEGSTVKLTSLDPCEGTFAAKIVALDPNGVGITIELQDGSFSIPRSAE